MNAAQPGSATAHSASCPTQPSPNPSRQGHFNTLADMPFAELDNSAIGTEAHLATARELAAKGTVLLKNEGVSC